MTYSSLINLQEGLKEKFINDLIEVTENLMISGKEKKMEGLSALYGAAQTIPDKSLSYELGLRYLDELYSTEHPIQRSKNQK